MKTWDMPTEFELLMKEKNKNGIFKYDLFDNHLSLTAKAQLNLAWYPFSFTFSFLQKYIYTTANRYTIQIFQNRKRAQNYFLCTPLKVACCYKIGFLNKKNIKKLTHGVSFNPNKIKILNWNTLNGKTLLILK